MASLVAHGFLQWRVYARAAPRAAETVTDPPSGGRGLTPRARNVAESWSLSTTWGSAGAVYDLSGNVKEWTNTEVASGVYAIRGGAYNNLEASRTCTFDFVVGDDTFAFPNTGFRCCYYDFP